MATVHPPSANVELAEPRHSPRFHDLDALRAVAMLLGILLHAMLAHIPQLTGLWPITDSQTSSVYRVIMAAIHGFRMPLFFLLSGFFTAMLWRRRGLKALLIHRLKRIFIPLVIGTLTVVPAVWIVSLYAASQGDASAADVTDERNLWIAARDNNLELIDALIAEDSPLDAQDPTLGCSPLTIAALFGNAEAAQRLLDAGANVNYRNRDNGTAAHAAFLFGHDQVALLLIENGADLTLRDGTFSTPIDSMNADAGTTQFIAGLVGTKVDQAEVNAGRKRISERLDEHSELPTVPTNESQNQAMSILYGLLFLFPFFHHLWFLWFLCWLVFGFAVYALLAEKLTRNQSETLKNSADDNSPALCRPLSQFRSWVVSPLRYLWLIPLLMLPQAYMGLQQGSFGPDTSSGLLPLPHVLLYYAIFFAFGVLYFDANDSSQELGRRWRIALPLALLIVFPLGYEFATHQFGFADRLLPLDSQRLASTILQATFAWLMSFGCIGLFRTFFAHPSKSMRYLSDASYWLYVMHLPLIIFVQIFTAPLQIPSVLKIILVTAVVTGLLLGCYQLFVRYTFIGRILNGPKTRPGS